jgi:hypothetical protein
MSFEFFRIFHLKLFCINKFFPSLPDAIGRSPASSPDEPGMKKGAVTDALEMPLYSVP